MDRNGLNKWLTLTSNIAVVVGIAFLIIELDQANRLSRYTAENARRSQFMEINSTLIETSELWAKLQADERELTPSERAKAVMVARLLINTWHDAESAYNYGLLSDETFESTMQDISVVFREAPGLIQFVVYLLDAYESEDDTSLVSRRLIEEVRDAGY
jgi:hypothetical protein